MHDTTREAIHNISNILTEEGKFDAFIIHILQKKLDCETIKIYETSLEDPKKSQNLNKFLLFLEKRFQSLEAIGNKPNRSQITISRPPQKAVTTLAATTRKCLNCKGSHNIEACKSFLEKSTMDRNKTCTVKNLCRICLGDHHVTNMCLATTKCWVCKGKHHTLLHTKEGASTNTNIRQQTNSLTGRHPTTQRVTPVVETHMVDNLSTAAQVILSTALVKVPTNGNHPELLRILIDPGSQASFITHQAAKKLNMQNTRTHVEFRGVGGIKAGVSEQQVTFDIEPRFSSNFKIQISALIVDQLVGNLPENSFNAWKWPHINNLLWADPNYNMPNKIDILLGADYYPAIILNEVIKGAEGEPIAQKTELGWIICGPIHHSKPTTVQCLITKTELDKRLKAFWEIKEVQNGILLTEDEQHCQEHYEKKHYHDSSGRYIVRLPFKTNPPILGTSKNKALARFLQLEKRFAISPLTNDPSDPTFLTPGHFLIGQSTLTQPETSTSGESINPLARWKLVQKMKEDFWKKRSQDYLHQLQQRTKWTMKTPNLKIGQLVLVQDKNTPPSRWITGRIEQIHPGEDGIVRVATLRGPGRVLIKRPVTKLAALPIEERTTEEQRTEVPTSALLTTAHHNSNNRKRRDDSEVAISHDRKKPRIWLRGQINEKIKEAAERVKTIPQPKTTRRKIRPCFQSKLMLYAMIPVLSILGVVSGTITESSCNIKSLNSTSGIYFENIGTAQLSHQQWTIISYFNLTSMFVEIKVYNATIDRMIQSCNNDHGWINLRQLCRPAILQMKQQLFNININNEIFQPTYTHARRKRGLVNAVGTLTNQLFGILDQDDAQRYNSEILSLKNNEQNMYKLLKEQITITESTINIIKKDWIAVNNQIQELDKQTVSILNLIQNKENENLAVQRFMGLWMHLSMEMTTFYSMQQQLIDVITDIHHSKINSLILKPNQLRKELQKLHEIIPADATIYEENNMMTLYQMMTAKVGQVKNALIFELKMPLVNNKIYQIIKPIPLPTKHKDMYTYIQPSSELLLISLNRESYYPMSEDELTSCKSIRSSEYICMIQNVIYNIQGNPTSCEINLIINKETHPNACQIQFMKPRNMWIPTHDPSAWIFIADKDHTINIICNKEVTTTPISGTGIITIQKACTITDGTTIIHSIENFNTRMKSFYQPTINLSSLLTQLENETYQNTTYKTIMHHELNNILTDLNQLATNVTHLKRSAEGTTKQINYHDVHHYMLLYGIVATIIGLIIVYRCKQRTKPPVSAETPQLRPLPRRYISTNVAPEDVQL